LPCWIVSLEPDTVQLLILPWSEIVFPPETTFRGGLSVSLIVMPVQVTVAVAGPLNVGPPALAGPTATIATRESGKAIAVAVSTSFRLLVLRSGGVADAHTGPFRQPGTSQTSVLAIPLPWPFRSPLADRLCRGHAVTTARPSDLNDMTPCGLQHRHDRGDRPAHTATPGDYSAWGINSHDGVGRCPETVPRRPWEHGAVGAEDLPAVT
jgi:hypothetical protein